MVVDASPPPLFIYLQIDTRKSMLLHLDDGNKNVLYTFMKLQFF